MKQKKLLFIQQSSIGVPTEQLTRVEARDICWTATTCARVAEKSPLLEAVARERQLRGQQAGKTLSECCGDLWRLVVAL
jgi:hypothetical protein